MTVSDSTSVPPMQQAGMPKCFFIRPFSAARAGHEDPSVFEAVCHAVKEAAAGVGVRLVDSAEDQRAGDIMELVRAEIDEADVIVALVTGDNPNVYFELGRARRAAIILARDKTTPFDIQGSRT